MTCGKMPHPGLHLLPLLLRPCQRQEVQQRLLLEHYSIGTHVSWVQMLQSIAEKLNIATYVCNKFLREVDLSLLFCKSSSCTLRTRPVSEGNDTVTGNENRVRHTKLTTHMSHLLRLLVQVSSTVAWSLHACLRKHITSAGSTCIPVCQTGDH